MESTLRKFKHAIGINSSSSSSSHPSSSRVSSSGRCPTTGSWCAICLNTMKPGNGNAIFTAECSHSFHFQCITSNVKHGNKICPVCRAHWKEVPFPTTSKVSSSLNVTSQPPRPQPNINVTEEPTIFNDDENLYAGRQMFNRIKNLMEIRTYPEVSAISKSVSRDNFHVLINLKAPPAHPQSSDPFLRVPIDLVTILDISSSMQGSKIALLKQAMSFVIHNLCYKDRLSIVVFSSTARRVFPLKLMNDSGRQAALQAIDSLLANGGTSIAEGLKKGVKVFVDRRYQNPVSSIMLLSDGQDNYNCIGSNMKSILPNSIQRNSVDEGFYIPVHTFGFGVDHDATLMHSISEISGGTFSFIQAENVIQDAFAQCIGGLLSVMVQELQVVVQCVHPHLKLSAVKAGSYPSELFSEAGAASIKVGDMYADEERNFLVTLKIPVDKSSSDEMSLLKVLGFYYDAHTKIVLGSDKIIEVKIQRPNNVAEDLAVSVEVDRQRNRLEAAEAMSEARHKAEHGDFSGAISVLEKCQKAISETVSAKAGDPLCAALFAELKEMQERMANRHVYEESGRAYVLSGLSSHFTQRATARGDSTNTTVVMSAYQTPSMTRMISDSQVFPRPAAKSNGATTSKKK